MSVAEYFDVVRDNCGGCHDADCVLVDGSGEIYNKEAIFSKREEKVLGRIRENRREAGLLLDRIHSINGDEDVRGLKQKALEGLEVLRRERIELETERVAAAEERMRFLGHA